MLIKNCIYIYALHTVCIKLKDVLSNWIFIFIYASLENITFPNTSLSHYSLMCIFHSDCLVRSVLHQCPHTSYYLT